MNSLKNSNLFFYILHKHLGAEIETAETGCRCSLWVTQSEKKIWLVEPENQRLETYFFWTTISGVTHSCTGVMVWRFQTGRLSLEKLFARARSAVGTLFTNLENCLLISSIDRCWSMSPTLSCSASIRAQVPHHSHGGSSPTGTVPVRQRNMNGPTVIINPKKCENHLKSKVRVVIF